MLQHLADHCQFRQLFEQRGWGGDEQFIVLGAGQQEFREAGLKPTPEPETKGAEITERNLSRAKYDANYRISGNFINWVVENYDKEIVRKVKRGGTCGEIFRRALEGIYGQNRGRARCGVEGIS